MSETSVDASDIDSDDSTSVALSSDEAANPESESSSCVDAIYWCCSSLCDWTGASAECDDSSLSKSERILALSGDALYVRACSGGCLRELGPTLVQAIRTHVWQDTESDEQARTAIIAGLLGEHFRDRIYVVDNKRLCFICICALYYCDSSKISTAKRFLEYTPDNPSNAMTCPPPATCNSATRP